MKDDTISRQTLEDLGAECIAKRDESGNLIPLGSIDSLPSVSNALDKIKAEIKALTDGAEPERIWNVDVLAIIDKFRVERSDTE